MPLSQMQLTGDFLGPSFSFAILFGALVLASYILWRRYQSRRLLMERVEELQQLSAAGRAIVAAELDVDALCALIAAESGKVIDNDTFQVGLFQDSLYEILFWTKRGQQQPTPQIFDLKEDPGIVGWVRHSGRSLLVRDFQKEHATLPASPRYISDTPPRSAIFIPLMRGDHAIGIIAAQSHQPGRFSVEDARRLMILANQAAAAVANAQLYEQTQMRAAQLELVGKIARQVNAVEELDAIFAQVVYLTHEMFGFQPVNIFDIDPGTQEVVLKASSLADLAQDERRLAPGHGIVGAAVSTRQTIVSNNTSEDERFIDPSHEHTINLPPSRAEMAVPLIVNENVLGVLDVNSTRTGAFTAAERTVLEALAAEVASAIHKAQQLSQQQERAWLTTAQLQVAATLSQGRSLEETLDDVARLTIMLAGVSLCGMLLWDEELAHYSGTTLYDASGHKDEQIEQLRCAVGDWHPLDAVHIGQEALTTKRIPSWLNGDEGTCPQALTLYPLHVNDRKLGVFVVDAAPRDLRGQLVQSNELLEQIVRQTSRAIENAYLRHAQQEEAWVNTVLLQVAEAVNSRLDLAEILETIVRLVPMLVGVESVIILIWDEESQVFRAGPSHGISTMGRGLIETLDIDHDEMPSLVQMADAQTAPMPFYIIQPLPWLEKVLGTPHAHVFPLLARGRLVGTMLVGANMTHGRSLPARRLSILNGIAQQAATAVVNYQLYQEAAERDRLAQELNVAREIQASLIPDGSPNIPDCSVASYWQAARQVSGDFYDFIPFENGDWGIVVADVADKGVPAALFMALSRTILRTVAYNRYDPAEVLKRVNDIIDSEVQSDLFVTMFYAIWQPTQDQLVYANGGHNPPLLLDANGNSRLLSGNGMALGILPGIEIESRSVPLYENDMVIFYTDGVTEAMNEDYDEFGMERMRLAAYRARHRDASDIMQSVTSSIREHAGETPQFDDITLVILKREDR